MEKLTTPSVSALAARTHANCSPKKVQKRYTSPFKKQTQEIQAARTILPTYSQRIDVRSQLLLPVVGMGTQSLTYKEQSRIRDLQKIAEEITKSEQKTSSAFNKSLEDTCEDDN